MLDTLLARARLLGFVGVVIAVACGGAEDEAAPVDASADRAAGAGGVSGTGGAQSGGTAGGGTAGSGAASGGAAGGDASDASGGTSSGDAAPDAAPACNNACTGYAGATVAGVIQTTAVAELSGLAASRGNPGVFYAHNDSGDSARFFAFAQAGTAIGEFVLQGASAIDWEDMAVGPCPGGSCVFLADFGDNSAQRPEVQLYRVAEPDVDDDDVVGTVTVSFESFRFTYANGPQNAEALIVHPVSGDVYVVSKAASGPSFVYRMPAPTTPGALQTLPKIADLVLPPASGGLVTGAAVHPTCDRVLIRTYDALYELRSTPPAAFDSIFAATPQPVPVAMEGQGEAVTYLSDGRGYATASEGQGPELHLVRCQ
jgi:hypothetical protein